MFFLSSFPSSVREYSTRGGISLKLSFFTKPSACRAFKVSDKVFGLMSPSSFIKLLNLSVPWFPRAFVIRRVHFLLITSIIPFRGQKQRCSVPFCLHSLSFGIVSILL